MPTYCCDQHAGIGIYLSLFQLALLLIKQERLNQFLVIIWLVEQFYGHYHDNSN